MEERDLLKGRLQAITEKHRIQESIRQKKLELDHDKQELQRLKKKILKERWLLQDSASHGAPSPTQIQSLQGDLRQTRALQLSIHQMEMEADRLEREESMISVNESVILNRLRTVEKSPEDIIKEAQDSFVPDPVFPVTSVIPGEFFPPASSRRSDPTPETKALFAMEVNVARNPLTGESQVLSTAHVAPEDVTPHAGLKVFDDGTKCVYAFGPGEGSVDRCGAQTLTASEVDHLLKSASEHHLLHQLNQRSLIRGEERCLGDRRDERGMAGGRELRNLYSDHALGNNMAEREFGTRGTLQRRPPAECCHRRETSRSSLEDRNNHSNQRPRHGNHKAQTRHHGNPRDSLCTSLRMATLPSVQGQHTVRGKMNGSGAFGYPPPRSHDQEVVAANQPQLCYTPAHHIPLTDYVSVDDDQLYCPSTTCYPQRRGSAHSDRPRSPFYGDDAPYTILKSLDATEPITAIFMGFQMAMDDSGQMHGCDGALRAELVVVGDEQESCGAVGVQEKESHGQPAAADPTNWKGRGGALAQRHGGAGIGKIHKKHQACCRVC